MAKKVKQELNKDMDKSNQVSEQLLLLTYFYLDRNKLA